MFAEAFSWLLNDGGAVAGGGLPGITVWDIMDYTVAGAFITFGLVLSLKYLCRCLLGCLAPTPAATALPPPPPREDDGLITPSVDMATLPSFAYEDPKGGDGSRQCPVCMGLVGQGEMVRQLPSCEHVFHVDCIDQWFIGHSTCPLCGTDAVAAAEPRPTADGAAGKSRSTQPSLPPLPPV